MKTEINIYIVLGLLALHWIADFVCQTDKMAQGKSRNWKDLLNHTCAYSLIFFISSVMLSTPSTKQILLFAPITFICHTITDYYTSRINAKLWEEKKVHQFFVSIGFDQLLHFTQLILTYYLLMP